MMEWNEFYAKYWLCNRPTPTEHAHLVRFATGDGYVPCQEREPTRSWTRIHSNPFQLRCQLQIVLHEKGGVLLT